MTDTYGHNLMRERAVHKIPDRRLLIISVILAVMAIAISLYAHLTPLFPGDLYLILHLQSFGNPALTTVMVWTSYLFTDLPAALIVIITGLIVGWRFGKLEGTLIWIGGFISLFADAFKLVINRPRPSSDQVLIIGVNHGSGFPSGHTFFATLFLGLLAYLLFTHLKPKYLKIISLVILILLMLLVGTSRIYLGAHWPSDVLGAYILGAFFLSILIWGDQRLKRIIP